MATLKLVYFENPTKFGEEMDFINFMTEWTDSSYI